MRAMIITVSTDVPISERLPALFVSISGTYLSRLSLEFFLFVLFFLKEFKEIPV
jgi:hypothetical protein